MSTSVQRVVEEPKEIVRDTIYRMKRGLCGYVSYLAACEMNQAFSEYVLYEPVLRILKERGFSVECEFECPGIQQPLRGDKKRLDFYAQHPRKSFALEMKWLRSDDVRIAGDVDKLRAFSSAMPGAYAFLCVFGRKSFVERFTPGGEFAKWGKLVVADMGVTKYACKVYRFIGNESKGLLHKMARPSQREIFEFLDRHQALLVHFSGAPKGAGLDRGVFFPDDLLAVLDGAGNSGLSCSAVKPGDVFDGFERNATGCVGLVVSPNSPESLVGVGPSDLGSFEVDGVRHCPPQVIDSATLEDSFALRRYYNEWVVRDFRVLGVFVARPFEVWRFRGSGQDGRSEGQLSHTDTAELTARFPGLPIYYFAGNAIRHL